MNKLNVLLCFVVSPAFAADPPDWYAHIPAEQRAAHNALATLEGQALPYPSDDEDPEEL